MYTIKIIPNGDNTHILLFKDGEPVEDFYKETPVEVAFKVRSLVEEYL